MNHQLELGIVDEEQPEMLERINLRIGKAIIEFCSMQKKFHADDLRKHVSKNVGKVAPGSADRILRDLRSRGVLNYRVLSRRASLYEVAA
ncbi:MAG: hypothetical protein ORN83_12890 [Chthoniobacteraceae bacterium]|nr:hypothetical protein [Chthoniobacteraceae bacterium]